MHQTVSAEDQGSNYVEPCKISWMFFRTSWPTNGLMMVHPEGGKKAFAYIFAVNGHIEVC